MSDFLDLYPNPDKCDICKHNYYGVGGDCGCTDGTYTKRSWWMFWGWFS